MRDYPLDSLAAGATEKFKRDCSYIRVKSSDGPLLVQAYDKDGKTLCDCTLVGGQALPLAGRAESVEITNESAVPVDAVLILGDGRLEDDNVSGSIILNAIGASDYPAYGMTIREGSGVGVYAATQLYNPVGSGKVLWVVRYGVEETAAGDIYIGRTSGGFQLTNNGGGATAYDSADAATVGELRYDNNASALSSRTTVENMHRFNDQLEKLFLPLDKRQIPIREGEGLVLYAVAANVGIYFSVEYEERNAA